MEDLLATYAPPRSIERQLENRLRNSSSPLLSADCLASCAARRGAAISAALLLLARAGIAPNAVVITATEAPAIIRPLVPNLKSTTRTTLFFPAGNLEDTGSATRYFR